MATNDVPGAKVENNDDLHTGCWAEHEDGSLIFVEGVEGGKVIYSVFDLSTDPITEYRDAMLLSAFEEKFSWDTDNDEDKWTWHDKTSFPWNKVIKLGAKDGTRFASADDLITAAKRVAKSRELISGAFKEEEKSPIVDIKIKPKTLEDRIENIIINKIQKALDKLDI